MNRYLLLLFIIGLGTFLSYGEKRPFNFYAQKAEEALNNGYVEDALDYARQEIIDYDNNPNGYYQAALSLYYLNQPGQAISMINKAIEKSKKDKSLGAQCYYIKANLLKETGDSTLVLQSYIDGLKLDPKNVDLLLEHANFITNSEPKTALKELQQAKKISPNDYRVYSYLAYLNTTQNNYKEALDEITRAIALDNTVAYNYGLRGLILKNLGYSPDWIRDCLKSTELDEGITLGTLLLAYEDNISNREAIINEIERTRTSFNGYYPLEANLLYNWGLLEPAARVYQETIDLGIPTSDTYTYLADCQKKLGFPLDAYNTVSMGLNKCPDNPDLKFAKAQIGIEAGKAGDVLEVIESLILEYPEAANAYYEKGRAKLNLGKYEEACEPLATAVILEPSVKNKLYYGDALRLSGKVQKANQEYYEILRTTQEEITKEGSTPEYIYAMAYSGLGDRDKAIKTVKEFTLREPDAEITYMPAIYARLGEKDKAIQALKDYSEKYNWNALFDLYTFNFHNLHSEQGFIDLLSENDVPTKLNPTTNLLEYEPQGINFSSGGTSLEDLMGLIYSDPYDWVRETNKLCPIDMGMLGQMVSVSYDDKTRAITYNYLTAPGMMNYAYMDNNPSYKKKKEEIMSLTIFRTHPELIKSGLTFVYNMQSKDKEGNATFTFTPEKIKAINNKYQSQDEIDQLTLDFWCEEEGLMLKQNPDSENAKVDFDGHVYSYLYPTSEEDLARMELFQSEMKKSLSPMFKDVSMKQHLPLFIRQNIILKFIYRGIDSGRVVEIVFTPEDFNEFLK